MGLNFLGLGFSFGAKDVGLESALAGLNNQFKQLDDSVTSFKDASSGAFSPAEEAIEGIKDQVADLLDVGLDNLSFDDVAVDSSDVVAAKDAVEGLGSSTETGATEFGRMANSVLGGSGKITGALGWIGLAIGPVIGGFGQAAESAGGMIDTLAGIPGRIGGTIHRLANDGINLTNSLEGEAVGMAQTARQVGVNMGYVGQDLNRFIGQATGMAMGLNIGADDAAKAIRGWDEAAETLGATGITSARNLAQLTAGLGIEADVLRNTTLEMRNLGASDDQIRLITSSLAAMGQQTGDVAGALNQLPDVIQMLERRRALGDTPEQMAAFAADTAAAARGLFAFTQDSERARAMAQQLAGTVTESREAFQNMFAGAEDQLPQLVSELSVVSGDVDAAFEHMAGGPGQLIEGMGQLVQLTRARGGNVGQVLEFMRGRLQQVFGNDMTATLVNFWDRMDDSTLASMANIRGASVDLGELGAAAHSTGRTLDEVFERMRAGFQTAFRRIARPAVRDFVRDTGGALRTLQRRMNEARDDTGALGTVMETLSLSSQIGGLALMPRELRSTTIAADELQGMVTPLIQSFTTWGGLVETVGSYVALFATEVILAKEAGMSWGAAIDKVADKFAGIFVKMIGKAETFLTDFANRFATFDWNTLFGGAEEGAGEEGPLGRIFRKLESVDWGGIWANIRKGFENLFKLMEPWLTQKMETFKTVVWERLGRWWSEIDWMGILGTMGDLAGALWTAVQPAFSELGDMIGQWLSDHWIDIVLISSAALVGAFVALVLAAIGAAVAILLAPVGAAFLFWSEAWERWGDDIIAYFEGLGEDIAEIWQFIVNEVGDLLRDFGVWIEETWQGVVDFFTGAWDGVVGFFEGIGEGIQGTIQGVVDWLSDTWNGFIQWFVGRFPETSQAVAEAAANWRRRFESIRDFAIRAWDAIKGYISSAVDWITTRFQSLVEGVSNTWMQVGAAISTALEWISANIIQPYIDNLSRIWSVVSETASTAWEWIEGIGETIQENLVDVATVLQDAWSGIVTFFQDIFARLGEALAPVSRLFGSIGESGVQALDSIMATAVRLFGGSINTVVGEDMASTEEVMTQAANNVSETMQTVLYEATVSAIVDGFSEGFAQVVENMGEFTDSMVEAFSTLNDRILEITSDLFGAVISQAEITMIASETAVEGIIGRLRTITQAQAALASARTEAIESLSRPADEDAMRRRLAQLAGNEVLQAIHHPDWYSGFGSVEGYRTLFIQHMNALKNAIEALGTAPATGAMEERRRIIREAAEAVRRGPGGQPRVPGGAGR